MKGKAGYPGNNTGTARVGELGVILVDQCISHVYKSVEFTDRNHFQSVDG